MTGGPHLCYNYSKVEEITNARVEVMTPKKWRVHSMALTRPFLKGMGLTEEQVSAIIEAHTETIDGLKSDRDKYKSDAAKLVDVQKELDGYKNGEDWQKKYNDLDKAFKDYKADVANQEKSRQIKSAYTKLLESANIDSKRIGAILKVTDFTNMKIGEDGNLEGSDKLMENIKSDWSAFVTTTETKGAKVETPPTGAGGSGKTKAEIMAIQDRKERRKAIAENPELFGLAPAN